MANIPVDALTAIIIAVIGLSQVAYIALGYKIYTEFGWKVYKLLGADRGIKRMFMHLQVFLCLTKFDVFFFVGFGVQVRQSVFECQPAVSLIISDCSGYSLCWRKSTLSTISRSRLCRSLSSFSSLATARHTRNKNGSWAPSLLARPQLVSTLYTRSVL